MIDNFLMSLIFTKSKANSNLYFKVEDGRPMMLLLYVDDLFLTRVKELIVDAKRKISTRFEMKYLGMMHYFLGMEAWKSEDGIFLGKGKYAMEILKRFKMFYYKEIDTPMASNLNILSEYSFESSDATMYRKMIG